MSIIKSKKGDWGIGTLIIFVAFILVASVAAGVLISVTSNLQSKALLTGRATLQEMGTTLSTVEIYAQDATGDYNVEYFYHTIKLSSGSEATKLGGMLITMSTRNTSQDYNYSNTINCSVEDETDNTSIYNSTNNGRFGAKYAIQSSGGEDGYIVTGDVVKLCYRAPRSIIEGEDIKISVLPQFGHKLIYTTMLPGLMYDQRIYMYP